MKVRSIDFDRERSKCSRAPGLRALLVSLLASAFILGLVASPASALPANFFGLQASGEYPDSPSDMYSVGRSGAKYWRLSFACFEWKQEGATKYFEKMDKRVKLAWENGLTIFPTLGGRCGSPSFAVPTSESEWAPGSDWEKFIYAVVKRYGYAGSFWAEHSTNKKEIENWEIWNEPNLGENWESKSPNGQTYGKLFKRSSEYLHAAQGTFFPTRAIFGGLYEIKATGVSEEGIENKAPVDFMKEAN